MNEYHDIADMDAIGDVLLRESYAVKVRLTQSTDYETGFDFSVMHYPACLLDKVEDSDDITPVEVGRGEGATYRLVDWNRNPGPDLRSMLDSEGRWWLAEMLEPVRGARMPEFTACLCEGAAGPGRAGEIVDISALDWIEIDEGHRGFGVGLLAAMRLVEMLPHGHDGLLAFHVRTPTMEAVRKAAAAGNSPRWIESGEGVLEPNNRLADYFATDGAFEAWSGVMVSRREAVLQAICGE